MSIIIKNLGLQPYQVTWERMKAFVEKRKKQNLADEIWFTEHPPVFTQGQAGKPEHLLHSTPIPVIQSDRGGQITYHGPGQLIAYVLLDLKARDYGIRELVCRLEQSIIASLLHFEIESEGRRDMPGVYTNGKKIASIGLRVTRALTYHGLSLNVNMDLSPFDQINTCGYSDLAVTQICDVAPGATMQKIQSALTDSLQSKL